MTTSGVVLVDQRRAPTSRRTGRTPRRRPPGPAARASTSLHVGLRLDQPGRVVRRAQERDVPAGARAIDVDRTSSRSSVKSAPAFAFDDRRAGEPGDVAVQLVGRLERGHACGRDRRTRAAASAAPRSSRWRRTPGRGARRATRRSPRAAPCAAVGIAVPFDPRQLGGERVAPRRRRRRRRLVGVQPHPHVDLGRVVALEGAQVVADGSPSAQAATIPTASGRRSGSRRFRSGDAPDWRR